MGCFGGTGWGGGGGPRAQEEATNPLFWLRCKRRRCFASLSPQTSSAARIGTMRTAESRRHPSLERLFSGGISNEPCSVLWEAKRPLDGEALGHARKTCTHRLEASERSVTKIVAPCPVRLTTNDAKLQVHIFHSRLGRVDRSRA